MEKQQLSGMSLAELQTLMADLGQPRFVARQLAEWLYKKQIFSFDEMTNVSKKVRQLLSERFVLGRTRPVESVESADGRQSLYRDGLYSRARQGHAVCLVAGGLQDGLPFLHDGTPGVCGQSHCR